MPKDATLHQTMEVLDQTRLGIVLVVDEDARLLGTVTDGDIRRGILCGVSLESPVSEVMNPDFISVTLEATPQDALDIMRSRLVKQVPVLDQASRVAGLFYMPDLVGAQERSNWAVLMAGGQGRRLRPLTENVPKPMLPVGGRPILERIVEHLVQHGFRHVWISVNYLGEQIESHFGNGLRFGCKIQYLREQTALDTAGALSLLPETPHESLLVINGDLVTDINLSSLMDFHAQHNCAVTQCVREFTYQIPYGVVLCEGHRVMATEEKPVHSVLINAGIYVLEPQLLELLPHSQPYAMPDLVNQARANGHAVCAFPVRERWVDVGRMEDYQRVRSGSILRENSGQAPSFRERRD